jgi:hypothetical protein
MAKVNATTNGTEKIITFIQQLYHISDIRNNFVTFMSFYYGRYLMTWQVTCRGKGRMPL